MAAGAMTFREMNLRVFQRKPIPHVLFQPRFEPWFGWHRQFHSLPPACEGKSLYDVYDDVGCSTRYMHYYTDHPSPVVRKLEGVKITEEVFGRECGDHKVVCYHTPHGQLKETQEFTVDRVWRVVDYCCKSEADIPALRWLLQRMRYSFNADHFRAGAEAMGDRGEPQFWVFKSPYLALAQQWFNFVPFMYAMHDEREAMEDLMRIIDESHDPLYEQLISAGVVRIVNFGENIAEAHMSPDYFDRYLQPWYEKRVGQLRSAGIFTHVHIDGYFKTLIPNIRCLPHDGLEALTPLPQGDVTLDELDEALGDKVLLDGIPAVLFLDHHPREQLQQCVEELIARFGDRLVLGISDELPEGAGDEGFDRLRWVAEYCRSAAIAPST